MLALTLRGLPFGADLVRAVSPLWVICLASEGSGALSQACLAPQPAEHSQKNKQLFGSFLPSLEELLKRTNHSAILFACSSSTCVFRYK